MIKLALSLTKVDNVMTKQINHLRCEAAGQVKATGDDFRHLFGKPEPEKTLADDKQKVEGQIKDNSKPVDISIAYADFLYRGTVTRCQVGLDESSRAEVDSMLDEVRPRWNIWFKLQGRCENAGDCFIKLYAIDEKLIASFRPDDLSDIKTRLDAVPRIPAAKYFVRKIDRDNTESSLKELEKIEEYLVLRGKLADAAQSAAQQDLSDMDKHLAQAITNANVKNSNLCQRADSIRTEVQECQNSWTSFQDNKNILKDLRLSLVTPLLSLEKQYEPVSTRCNIMIGQQIDAMKHVCP